MRLAELIRGNSPAAVATATPATFATHRGTVATVATVAVAKRQSDETRGTSPAPVATLTLATPATLGPTVATVATVAVAKRQSDKGETPATVATVATVTVANPRSDETDTADTRARLLALAAAGYRAPELVRQLPEAELAAWAEWLRAVPAEQHPGALRAWLDTLADEADMRAGRKPPSYDAPVLCARCGPVWLPAAQARLLDVRDGWPRALGCPWCFIRAAGGFIPRPPVRAGDCTHWHPDGVNPAGGRGQCACGSWWPGQAHPCGKFVPRAKP